MLSRPSFCIALRHARYFSGEKHSVYHRFGDILLRVCWIPEKLPINDILWSLLSAVVIAFVRDSVLGISYGHYFRIPCVVFLEQYGNAHAVLGLFMTPPGELSSFLSSIHMPTGVILGLMVIFRFFPTMKAELKAVGLSMKNRGLTSVRQFAVHPLASVEYVLVPLLLRILQIADQLAVSAVARGAECPGVRKSYYETTMHMRDWCFLALWGIVTAAVLCVGGVKI